jgi:hypothetical protein
MEWRKFSSYADDSSANRASNPSAHPREALALRITEKRTTIKFPFA